MNMCRQCGTFVNKWERVCPNCGSKIRNSHRLYFKIIASALTVILIWVGAITGLRSCADKQKKTLLDPLTSEEMKPILSEETKQAYEWVVQPEIQADDINVLHAVHPDGVPAPPHADSEYFYYMNLRETQLYRDVSLVRQGDNYGLIDYDGAYVLEPEYFIVAAFPGDKIGYQKGDDIWYAMDRDRNVTCYETEEELPEWEDTWSYILMDAENGKLYHKMADDSFEEMEYEGTISVNTAVFQKDYNGKIQAIGDSGKKFAIVTNGRRVTDFEYDGAGVFSDGLIAVRKDMKWGFVNAEGEVIIPVEYESTWDRGPFMEQDDFGIYYTPSDGKVVVKKDGKWGYLDTNGKEITGFVFEEARPSYQNCAWVKQNGKWGVIRFGD